MKSAQGMWRLPAGGVPQHQQCLLTRMVGPYVGGRELVASLTVAVFKPVGLPEHLHT
ncbi:hypothetical protein [Deinococcus deserti]|uniref:hypothetical protein n=1 Tax=Deinococcus deserti TaxID=310783 RepID=UPI00139247B4|nr:hypothetical protein [Deinococcus deserti]